MLVPVPVHDRSRSNSTGSFVQKYLAGRACAPPWNWREQRRTPSEHGPMKQLVLSCAFISRVNNSYDQALSILFFVLTFFISIQSFDNIRRLLRYRVSAANFLVRTIELFWDGGTWILIFTEIFNDTESFAVVNFNVQLLSLDCDNSDVKNQFTLKCML